MRRIAVWDLPTRIFHWTLVASVATAYLISSGRPTGVTFLVHVTCGYLVVLLLLFRLAWGFFGGEHARFRAFVRGPASALAYARSLLGGTAPRFVGHNPAGAAMIVLILVTLVLLVATGLLAEGITGGAGPLSGLLPDATARAVGEIHQLLGNGILVLAGIHIAGVVVESVLQRENLAATMITGRKPAHEGGERDAGRAPIWRAVVLVAVLAALAAGMVSATAVPPPRARAGSAGAARPAR